jgi:hypothetical protein
MLMKKHDEGRRAFLVGTAAGAAATAALVPDALAKSSQQVAAADAPGGSMAGMAMDAANAMAPMSNAHGAFFNDDDSRTIKAFAERLMPGAPGKPGATDADVLNYIDLGVQQAVPQSRRRTAGRGDRRARTRQGARIRLADRASLLQHCAHAHDGRDVRRPGLWR